MRDRHNVDNEQKPPVYSTPDGWFVTTANGPHGPLASEAEAERYRSLLDAVSAARASDCTPDDAPPAA